MENPVSPAASSDISMSSDTEAHSPSTRVRQRRRPTTIQTEERPRANRIKKSKIYFYPTIRIGQGATAVVYKGYFREPENEAAIKCIRTDFYDVYENEIFIWKQVDDSLNIVRLFDFEEWKQPDMKHEYYIAMQLADTNLGELVKSNTRSKLELTKFVNDAAEGLCWLFKQNIIHRDIKPDNILIFEDRAKLGDFGVSRKLQSMTLGTDSTGKATLDWAAPEVIDAIVKRQTFPNKPSQDIFSLGLTLCYAMYARHPYGDVLQASNIYSGNQTLLLSSDDFTENALIAKMLEREPDERPKIQGILKHPVFWDAKRSLQFIVDVAIAYENKRNPSVKCLRDSLDKHFHDKIMPRWYIPEIDPIIFCNHKKWYNKTSLFSLVELIRDKYVHFQNLDSRLYDDELFGTDGGEFDEEKYISYFLGKFPHLVYFLYEMISLNSFIMLVPRNLQKEYYAE